MNRTEHGTGRGRKILRIIGMVIAGMAFAVVFALVFGLAVQYLWNWLMPEIFGLKAITYWQAFGIVILAKIFFGSFGGHHGGHGGECGQGPWKGHGHHRWHGGPWKHDWKYFDRYWEEEGKAAFGEYVKKLESEKKEEG
jgi:hypothetical protein